MRICVLAVLILAILTGEAQARKQWFSGGYCSASYGYSAGYYSPGYYEVYTPPVVINVAAFVPYLAYTPVAFSTYQPAVAAPALVPNPIAPVAPARQSDCEVKYKALEARLLQLEKGQPQPQQALPTKGLGVMARKCGGCHEAKVAQAEGASFVLLEEGRVVPLTDGQLLKVMRNVLSSRMPKNGKLEDEEGSQLMEYLDSIKPTR